MFPTPSHLAPSYRVISLRIYGKTLLILKLESSKQPMVKIWWSYSLQRFWLIRLCDGRTDGRTDRIAMAKTPWKQ